MDNEIDRLLEKAGRKNQYQYIVSLLFFIMYGAAEYIAIVLPFLQSKPEVDFTVGNKTYHAILNYTICENYKDFTIDDDSYLSLIEELGIECNKIATIL